MSARQFDQFGPLQAYEYLEPNVILLYFVDAVVVVNLEEEEFIVLRAEGAANPVPPQVDE